MCGFLGAFGLQSQDYQPKFSTALESITHRGPDDGGIWVDPSHRCILGHRRLSIIDLSSAAAQPFRGNDDVLVYNGEIYNHLDIRHQFFSHIQFSSTSDTETLFYLCKEKEDYSTFLSQLDGMFAGAFYKKSENTLYLFRDGLSIKPLYYIIIDQTILFASEIRALLCLLPEEMKKIDEDTVSCYLTFENWPQGPSLFQGIKSVLPGEIFKIRSENDQLTVHKESFLKRKSLPKPTPHSLEEYIVESIDASVQQHLLSDVPLGTYLSGGLDSSIVTTLAARHTKDLMAFIGYFDIDEWHDERPLARQVAKQSNVPLMEVKITPQHFYENFDKVILSLEEPRMGMGTFSQYIVAEEAAKHRKVILAGHGGDELFGGYPIFKAFHFLESPSIWEKIQHLKSFNVREFPWLVYLMVQKVLSGKTVFAPTLSNLKVFNKVASSSFAPSFQTKNTKKIIEDLFTYYQTIYLPGLFSAEDKISMAHSLETRFPLWSQSFIEKMKQIPIEALLHEGQLKGLYKKALKNYLPQDLLYAGKKGFPTPLRHWFRQELASEVEKRLLHSNTDLYKWISFEFIARLVNSHKKNVLPYPMDEKRAHQIWILLCLESWMRQFGVKR